MESNYDNAKKDFLKKSVVNSDTSNSSDSNRFTKKSSPSSSTGNPKDFKQLIKNVVVVTVILGLFFYTLRSCNKDKSYYYENSKSYFESGETEKGFEEINEAIDMDNTYADALLLRGKQYMKIEEYQDAEYDFTELINLDEKNWKAYYLRAKSYMGIASSKYSSSYEKAINDFTTSIALESGSENSDSYFLRGDSKEISLGEFAGCADFNLSCDLGHEEGCNRYNELCYPKTGFMPYEKYFGIGVHSGQNTINLDNKESDLDILVVVQDINTGVKVRSQFIRKREYLTMENIPNGNFHIKSFDGNIWTFDELMPDNITKGGFSVNQNFRTIKKKLICFNCEYTTTLYTVIGGNSEMGEEIDFNEFMK